MQQIVFVAEVKKIKRRTPSIYDNDLKGILIWFCELLDYGLGRGLKAIIRWMVAKLAEEERLNIKKIKDKRMSVPTATIDRLLRPG